MRGCIHQLWRNIRLRLGNFPLYLLWKTADHRFVGVVDHHGQLLFRETGKVDGVPVGLLYRGTVIPPGDDTGVALAKHLARKGSAFQGDLVRVNLGEDFTLNLDADGPFAKRIVFIGIGLGETVTLNFFNLHNTTKESRRDRNQ